MDKWLVLYADQRHWRSPRISFDVISPLLHSGAITTSGFEQTGELVVFRPMLGNNIMGVEKPEALTLLANSDFFILTTLAKIGVYPFYHQPAQYWSDLQVWAEKNMIVVRTVTFKDFTATVYARCK